MQRGRRRSCIRCLYHRQRREQSHRPADLRRDRRSPGPRLEFLLFRGAQSRRRGAGLLHRRSRRADGADGAGAPALRSLHGSSTCATRNCARLSASDSASCSRSSARSPTSISCWCARRCRSARWQLGFVYFVFLPSIVTTLLAGRSSIAGAPDRHCGVRWRSPASACRCFCRPASRAVARDGARGRRDVLRSGDRDRICSRAATADRGRRAGFISPATSPAVWSAPRSSVRCSTGSDGRPASLGLHCRSPPPRSSTVRLKNPTDR